MGRDALGRQPQALVHAETVLLIHHGEHEVPVGDIVLEERMCADDDLRLAGGDAFENGVALAAFGAARQDVDGDAGRRRHARERGEMLARQDFRRRHQHGLSARFDRRQHRHQRHRGFSCADIALQEPQHALFACHVLQNLCNGRLLAVRQREGQGVDDRAAQRAGRDHRSACNLAQALAHKGERNLAGQEFVIGKPATGGRLRIEIRLVSRIVQAVDGVEGRGKTLPLQQGLLDPFRQVRNAGDGRLHRLAQHA